MTYRTALPALTAVAFAVLITAPSARAGTITINFDLSDSVISVLGGVITIPPDGSITSSQATVTIQGSSLTNPIAGPASLSNLSLLATINGTVGGVAVVTGGFSASQPGTAVGSLTGGLASLAIGTLSLNVVGLINCSPAGPCAVLGTFPVSVSGLTPITGVGGLGLGGLGTFGNGTLSAILSVTIDGTSALISLVGTEISRTFAPSVPEPGTFGMFGLGMLGLAGAGWRRSRR